MKHNEEAAKKGCLNLDIVAEPDRPRRSSQPTPSDRVAGLVDSTLRDVAPMIDNAIKILFRGTR